MQKHECKTVYRYQQYYTGIFCGISTGHVQERCTTLQFTVPMKNIIVLRTTVAKREDARKIAQILLDIRLVACAQIDGPIESIYRWKGSIETSKKYRLSLKTISDFAPQVIEKIQSIHPYEVAEIVGESLQLCSMEYQNWLLGEVSDVSA